MIHYKIFWMMKILITFLLMNSLFIYFSKTPLLMLLFLIIQTLLITMTTTLLNSSSWHSYMLFLILIGGLLILFIYINSLIPNQKINFKLPLMYVYTSFILIIMLLNNNYYSYSNNTETEKFFYMEMTPNFLIKLIMNKLYNKPTNFTMFMLMNYLLWTLMIAVKIININMGPIRKNIIK
uniref:NADH dehydrogenase subunit 6 n=1 Tax=Athalia sp. 'qingzang' TaxID=2983452 RepID=A0A977TLC9_9HYME|nr:NADH dehydrogenase subunit 6 [Athalia japonica]UXW93539.1 NADH dehydrogenase subunit 6 [Athalia japonica]UXW93565.1 NADH dehydrogenase subunit 6 [Athalia sp. 'qingzang']